MKYLYTLTLLLFFQLVNAQDFQIKGTVKDSTTQEVLPYANVILKNPSDSILRTDITNSEGQFTLEKVEKGQYTLHISFVGFTPYIDSIDLDANLQLGDIILSESSTELDELTIEGEAIPVVVKKDTLEYNAAAFTVPEGSELEDLLNKMPGVKVKDGAITVNGKRIEKLLVDGKPFFDGQIQSALKNLPADFAKKIQFIEEKSEQAQFSGTDDGERTQTMNVVSKPEKRKGYFGRIGGTLSPPDRYNLNGSLGALKGDNRYNLSGSMSNLGSESSISIPSGMSSADMSRIMAMQGGSGGIGGSRSLAGSYYREFSEKLEINASLRWSNSDSFSETDITRQYIQSSDQGRVYTEQSERNRESTNISTSVSLNYKPSKKDHFSIRQTFTSANSLNSNWKTGETILNGDFLNSTLNRSYMENERIGLDTRLSWRHRFKKEGRTFSFTFGNSYNKAEGTDSVKSQNRFADGNIQEQDFDQVSNPEDNAFARTASVTFTEKVGEKSNLSFRYNFSHEQDKTEQLLLDFNENTQAYSELDPLRSSEFELNNKDHKFNFTFNLPISEKIYIGPKLAYRTTTILNDQVYPNEVDTKNQFNGFTPSISIDVRAEKSAQLRATLSRSMRVPRAEQLQNVLDNSNPLFLRQGNPDLKQGFTNSINISYYKFEEESGVYSSLSLYATSSENQTTNFTIVGDGTNSPNGIDLPIGARYSRPVNISGAKNINFSGSTSIPLLKKKLSLALRIGGDYAFNPQFLNEVRQSSESFAYSLGFGLESKFSEKLDLGLSVLPRYSIINNSSPEDPSSRYFAWNAMLRTKWTVAADFYLTSNINYSYNGGVNNLGSFDQLIWSASLGKKILKKKLDLNIQANDILKQLSDQNRSINSEYIQNSSTILLRQILRFSITYKFNKFG